MYKKVFYYLLFFFSAAAPSAAQKESVYNMFLEETVPANGSATVFNSPILRWPYQKGKQVSYDIQLSQDSVFRADKIISQEGLAGAIFNPHQSLAKGKWYWHYRVKGKTWSPVFNFLITPKALPMVSPSPQVFLSKVPLAHPRILMNRPDEQLHTLSVTADAKAIIREAEVVLQQPILKEESAKPAAKGATDKQDKKINQDAVVGLGNKVNEMVLSLCEAYLLNGDKRYTPKAIAIAMEVAAWDPKGLSGSSDFMDGICMYNMALVYDTFYDQLTDAQKNTLQKAISERAAKFYKSWVNNIESKVLSGHVWQLLLNEFFKTAIALYRHEPDAEKWLAYAYELFLERSPVLGGLDGGWAEGVYYFQLNMETLLEIPDKIKTYTGFDFVKAHPWYQNQANWLIYNFPAKSSADGFGDNTEELFEPPASYAAFATEMARLTQNPAYSWYAKQLEQQQHIDLSTEPRLRWYRLVHAAKQTIPPVTDSLHFVMGNVSKEVGVAALHTHLINTPKDIMVSMRSSPFGAYGHVLADQNAFNILAGGKRLFYRTGYKVSMDDPHRLGWSKHTKSENGILINGEGQPYSVEAYGHFSRVLQGEQLSYIKGDASFSYQSKETKENYGVTKALRHVVLLKPGIVIIYDELESAEDASWSWLIHSLENMKLDSLHQTFTATIENAKGTGKLWSSQNFTWNLSNKFDVPPPEVNFRNYAGMRTKKYEDTQWHLKAVNNNKTKKIRFLSVIQVSLNGIKPLPFTEIKSPTGITRLQIGDWEIEAVLDDQLAPQLAVRSLLGKTAFAAYGTNISFHGQQIKGTIADGSKLLEWINGKINFKETGEEPVANIR